MKYTNVGRRWTRKSIFLGTTLAVTLSTLNPFTNIQAGTVGTAATASLQEGGRARMNVAGNMAILSQTIAAAACMLDEGFDVAHERALLQQAHDDFARMLHALEHGDIALGVITPEARAQTVVAIRKLHDLWTPIDEASIALLAGDHPHEHAKMIAQSNQALLEQAELVFSIILNDYADPFNMQMADAVAISFAERQEMFAEKLKREACEIGGGHADASVVDDFVATMDLFGASLDALHDGYPAAGIRPPPNDVIALHLEQAKAEWIAAAPILDIVLQSDGATEAQMIAIREVTESLDHTMHRVVVEYLLAAPGAADMIVGPVTGYANTVLHSWATDPTVVAAVKAHNTETAKLSIAELTGLNDQWVSSMAGDTDYAIIDAVDANPASERLVTLQAQSHDIVTEAFVVGLRGTNVAESEPTEQYWHKDEPRFLEITYGPESGLYISDVHLEEETGLYQAQVSLPINDPETAELIGVAVFGINVQSMF